MTLIWNRDKKRFKIYQSREVKLQMEHYFSESPDIKSEKRKIEYSIGGKNFEFITDNGVFSKLKVDLLLESDQINKKLLDDLSLLEPFGYGNPRPTICLSNLVVYRKTVMGKEENHLKLK